MSLFMESAVTEVALGAVTLLFVTWYYLNSVFSYWKNRGIPYAKPHLLFGNSKDLVLGKKTIPEAQHDVYEQLKGERFGGFYQLLKPTLMIMDPELINNILVKDFNHFIDRGISLGDPEKEPLSYSLFTTSGHFWRNLRYKLTPTFSTGKLKGMFEQISNCCENLIEELKRSSKKGEVVEPRKVLSLFTTDMVATIAFGLQFEQESKEGKLFRNMAQQIFEPSRFRVLRYALMTCNKKIAYLFNTPFFPRDISNYFIDITKETIKYRNENHIKRNDFLQLLMTLKEKKKGDTVGDINEELKGDDAYLMQSDYKPSSETIDMTDEIIAAQAFSFISAGVDTISGLTSILLYCIAANPTVQKKIHEEVDNTLAKHGDWSYTAVKEMTYLDQTIQEGFRYLPITTRVVRVCTIPYKIPGTDFVIEKGQPITIPTRSIHMDPEYYPDPGTFNPDRFKGNNYRFSSTFLPFGNGPRMCIAMRFSLLEMKICLAKILAQFSVTVNSKTMEPLQLDPRSITPRIKGGLWLDVKDRKLSKG